MIYLSTFSIIRDSKIKNKIA